MKMYVAREIEGDAIWAMAYTLQELKDQFFHGFAISEFSISDSSILGTIDDEENMIYLYYGIEDVDQETVDFYMDLEEAIREDDI
jgi:hypothetical protein